MYKYYFMWNIQELGIIFTAGGRNSSSFGVCDVQGSIEPVDNLTLVRSSIGKAAFFKSL